MAVWDIINLKQIRPDRFDAEYFRQDYIRNISFLSQTGSTDTIGSLFRIVDRGEKAEYDISGTIPVLRSVNIRNLGFNSTRTENVTEEFYKKKSKGQIKKADILITSTGTGTLGRAGIWTKEEKAFNVPENSFLRGARGIDPFCVVAFLNTNYGIDQFFQNQRGSSGQLHLYPNDIKRIIIPTVILGTNNGIGLKIRHAFDKESISDSLYTQATQLLEQELGLRYLQLNSLKSFSTKFNSVVLSQRLDSNHYMPKFKQLIEHIKSNFHYSFLGNMTSKNTRGVQPKYILGGDKKVVTSQHITSVHLKFDELETTSESFFSNSSEAHIKYGDILIYTTGAYVGQTNSYLLEDIALASNHVNILRLKTMEIDPVYVAIVLNSTVGKLQTEMHIRGSAQAELYPSDLSKFIIPLLDKHVMKEIGDFVRKSFNALKESKILIEQAKSEVETLIKNAAINAS